MVPRRYRVAGSRQDSADTRTLRLEPVDEDAVRFASGQFAMLDAFGVGEAALSFSGDPADAGGVEHTVRDVGPVSHAVATAAIGSMLGVRGPFGTGWQVADARGGDLVLVAGGIGLAPLRPAVLEVCASRGDYGRVAVRYGARTPAEILYPDDLRDWARWHDIDVQVTVDDGREGWTGRVGLVTQLLTGAVGSAHRTTALVCGPEAMMRHAARALLGLGLSPARLRLSMERNMKCGVGLCGHCQLRELLLCVDGPVLSYDRLAPLMALAEL